MAISLVKPPCRPGLTLTDRDELIIWSVYIYRLVSIDQLMMITKSKNRNDLKDRLRDLWGCDYIDRPEIQKEIFSFGKTRPTIQALGNKGALWLTNNKGIRFPKSVDWTAKNKNIKSSEYVKHMLGVTETMLQAERDINAVEGLRFADRDEVWATSPHYNPEKKDPFKFPTELTWKGGAVTKRKTVPDRPFSIMDYRKEEVGKGLSLLEYDRWTESYVRTDKGQSAILQKFLGYVDVRNRKLHTQIYGHKNFRVLWVIEGTDVRIDGMINTYNAHVKDLIPAGAFLFTTVDRLKEKGFLSSETWINAKREPTALVQGVGL